jgi:two-component system, sensor histidine kinase and response regulator
VSKSLGDFTVLLVLVVVLVLELSWQKCEEEDAHDDEDDSELRPRSITHSRPLMVVRHCQQNCFLNTGRMVERKEHHRRTNDDPPAKPAGRLLLIDDDADVRRLVARVLQRNRFEVVVAESGAQGLQLATESPPDLVVCDLAMPGMDGYEVLARLRQDSRLANIPVIFLTGQAEPEQIRAGMNLGADDYLTKPVEPNNLVRAINARLERVRLWRQNQESQMERALEMFASVVHELRDPLFVVFGYANMLRPDEAAPRPSENREAEILERMQQAIERMQAIVSETMFLAKSKMQRLPFLPQPLDLRVLAEQVIAEQTPAERLRLECAESECLMVGDPMRLRQALENLLSNALKYSAGPVVVRLVRRPAGFNLEVQDSGIGIPVPEQARVFDPFFRASNTGAKPGHGLGLSIVKTCAELHGGAVRLTSEAGRGSVFVLELPATPAAAPSRTLPSPAPAPRGKTKPNTFETSAAADASVATGAELSAIIVDADAMVRDVLRDLLTRSGEIVVIGEAGTVAQARQLVAERPPDVVFLEINLPDAQGFELLPHLAAGTAVVFVTSAEEYALNAFDADAVDYLLKPVSAERLQKALQRLRHRLAPVATQPRLSLTDTFLVKTMSEKKLIKVQEVKCLIAYGEYSWIHWDQGKGALQRKSLKQWESELPETHFVRVHRNAIINLAYLDRLEKLPSGRLQVHLRDTADPISVSLRMATELNRRLKTFRH